MQLTRARTDDSLALLANKKGPAITGITLGLLFLRTPRLILSFNHIIYTHVWWQVWW